MIVPAGRLQKGSNPEQAGHESPFGRNSAFVLNPIWGETGAGPQDPARLGPIWRRAPGWRLNTCVPERDCRRTAGPPGGGAGRHSSSDRSRNRAGTNRRFGHLRPLFARHLGLDRGGGPTCGRRLRRQIRRPQTALYRCAPERDGAPTGGPQSTAGAGGVAMAPVAGRLTRPRSRSDRSRNKVGTNHRSAPVASMFARYLGIRTDRDTRWRGRPGRRHGRPR